MITVLPSLLVPTFQKVQSFWRTVGDYLRFVSSQQMISLVKTSWRLDLHRILYLTLNSYCESQLVDTRAPLVPRMTLMDFER